MGIILFYNAMLHLYSVFSFNHIKIQGIHGILLRIGVRLRYKM